MVLFPYVENYEGDVVLEEHLILGGRRAPVRVLVNGEFIRKKRHERGLTQESVASPLGLLRQRISDLERGHSHTIEGEYVEPLSIVLGCEVRDLIILTPSHGILLGDTVRSRRKQLGMTVADMAYEIGTTVDAYSHYEAGHKRAPFEVAWRLSKYFEDNFGYPLTALRAPIDATVTPEYEDYSWLEYRDHQGIWHLYPLSESTSPEIEEDTANSGGWRRRLSEWWAAKGSSAA